MTNNYLDYLAHYGIKGQKKGVRRYQNEDGSYTQEGAERYWGGGHGRQHGAGQNTQQSYNKNYTGAKPKVQDSSGSASKKQKPYAYSRKAEIKATAGILLATAAAVGLTKAFLNASRNRQRTREFFNSNPSGWRRRQRQRRGY